MFVSEVRVFDSKTKQNARERLSLLNTSDQFSTEEANSDSMMDACFP